jgi:NADP-dependent 3-hydroxy acid dehydrogenase YdfG
VIASGRRKENLGQLVQNYGQDKVSAAPFDITNLDGIPRFATNITTRTKT